MTSWDAAPLGSLVRDVKPGFACGEDDPGGVFQLRMNNVTRGGKLDLAKRRRVPRGMSAVSKSLLSANDVLFNSTNSPEMVGKTLLFQGGDEPTVYSNHFLRIRVDESKLDPAFLASWLLAQFSRGVFLGMCRQWVNQATVGKDALLGLRVPLPPIAEQKRIVAVLEQVDALRAKRREVITLLDDLAQSVFLDMFGDPFQNPKDFPVHELSSLVADGDRINYGVVQPGGQVDGGIPLIRSGDLGRYGVDRSNLMSISSDVEASYARSRIRGNEILIGCVGAIGSVSVVTREDVGSNVARAVARIPISDGFDREYIAAYLRMDFVQQYFERELRTVAQPTLNIKQIKEAPVVFPPRELRSRFVERANQVARQRATYKAYLTALDELFESVQQRAFAGQLWDHEAA